MRQQDLKQREEFKETADKLSYAQSTDPWAKKVTIRSIERLTGKRRFTQAYMDLSTRLDDGTFWNHALGQLEIGLSYDREQLAKIPAEGPVVFVANHPFGVLDGIAICNIASLARDHFKILIHRSLCREERIRSYLLPIDFSETKEATLINIDTKKQAIATLKDGGAVVIFPAGGISTSIGPFGPVTDLEWKTFVAKLVQGSKATVVPIYFPGQNSRLFQMISQVSDTLRLALIMHEVNKRKGDTMQAIIGDPIPYEQVANIKRRGDLTEYLRRTVYADLGGNEFGANEFCVLPTERRAEERAMRKLEKKDRASVY
ncbi:MAG: lysophospholipid acyltransferase family protein [Chloroflexota bacterium]